MTEGIDMHIDASADGPPARVLLDCEGANNAADTRRRVRRARIVRCSVLELAQKPFDKLYIMLQQLL